MTIIAENPLPVENRSAMDNNCNCSGWPAQLCRMNEQLLAVAGTTEDEFLAIGAKLHEFYQRAEDISAMSTQMVSQVAGDEINDAIKGLQEITAQMDHYLNRTEVEMVQSSQALANILRLLDNAAAPLAGYRKINKVLRMLGISTKIESARLGHSAAGFETLANDVAQLSVQVSEKAGTILVEKESLSAVINQTLAQVQNLGDEQRQQVRQILGKTGLSLTALTEVNGRCARAAAAISTASAEVSQNIGEVVTSMQFHDIVRQQIEHVAEALADLHARLNACGEAGAADVRQMQAEDAGAVCELQAAQLRHASGELDSAVQSIIGNLREIAAKESRMSGDTREMAGVADQTGSTFLSEMEADLTVVAEALGKSAAANRNLAAAMNTVAQTVGAIAGFVSDIEDIGDEIELIALNAQIKAALTGRDGAALGVLAEAIQRLSVDAIMQTNAVSDTLKEINAATDGLCSSVNSESTTLDMEVQGMALTLGGLVGSLQTVNGNLAGCLANMDMAVQSLSADIEYATGGMTAHDKVTQVLSAVGEELAQVIGAARLLAPAGFRSAADGNFQELADRYTMHSERKIHAAMLNAGCTAAGAASIAMADDPPIMAAPQGEGEELGGNVELF